MGREHADVVLGGLTLGFAFVETDEGAGGVSLASLALLSHPTAAVTEAAALPACGCRPEDLALAQVRSRRGAGWSLGVKVCAQHRRLRPA